MHQLLEAPQMRINWNHKELSNSDVDKYIILEYEFRKNFIRKILSIAKTKKEADYIEEMEFEFDIASETFSISDQLHPASKLILTNISESELSEKFAIKTTIQA